MYGLNTKILLNNATLSGFELYSRWVPLSTETALVRVHNDILKAVDDNKSVILLLLDLSAAL